MIHSSLRNLFIESEIGLPLSRNKITHPHPTMGKEYCKIKIIENMNCVFKQMEELGIRFFFSLKILRREREIQGERATEKFFKKIFF